MRKSIQKTKTLAQFRRMANARLLEKQLVAEVKTRSTRIEMNGAVGVPSDIGRWLQKPKPGEPKTAIFKAMDREAKDRHLGVPTSDWMWAVLREAQHKNVIIGAERGKGGSKQRKTWRTEQRATSTWESFQNSVMEAAVSRCGRKTLLAHQRRAVWQVVKRQVPGQGGVRMMQVAVWSLALTRGLEAEGLGETTTMSGCWDSKEWWEETVRMACTWGMAQEVGAVAEIVLGWQDGSGRDDSRKVWLHWCAGDGRNVHGVARSYGRSVIAVDLKEGYKAQVGVQRVQMDLGNIAETLWIREVCRLAGVSVDSVEAMLGGPPCRTYSHSDPSNKRRGCNWQYRDHGKLHRPPMHPAGTKKGDLAREHDDLTTKMANLCSRVVTPWYIENPEAYLRYRTQMQQLPTPKTVHYCAYWTTEEANLWRPIQKPTNIWTNVTAWDPRGSTGTGKCQQRCRYRDSKGRHQKLEGPGMQWLKSRMPAAIVKEWAQAWMSQ
jgi:hypothetical protein